MVRLLRSRSVRDKARLPDVNRIAASVLTVALAAACGRASTSPSPTDSPPLPDGRYVWEINGDVYKCTAKPTTVNPYVEVLVDATHDDKGNWIAKPSTPGGGDFVLVLRRGARGLPPPTGIDLTYVTEMTGTASGVAVDSYVQFTSLSGSGRQVVFPAATPLSAYEFVPRGFTAGHTTTEGEMRADVAFTQDGISSTCPNGTVIWFLSLAGGS